MSDIFISYARSTAAQAEQIGDALIALGYSVWRDDKLPVHRAYSDVIEAELKAAKAVVVIWSVDAAKSEWVRSEADRARSARKLVQVTVDGSALPMPFDQILCADLIAWNGNSLAAGWQTVVASVSALTDSDSAADIAAPKARLQEGPVLAVLPFDNLSADADMQFFSDGVSEEIIQRLSRGSNLKLIGRTSSFQFRGERKADAARTLHCTHVLNGSIRRAGDRVRASAHLVDASSGTSLWSDRYDRTLEDIFAVQDDIAENIAAALDRTFSSVSTTAVDPAVYDLYLRASLKSYAPEELRTNIGLLEVATQRASHFTEAWARLAYLRAWLRFYQPFPDRAASPRRWRSARRNTPWLKTQRTSTHCAPGFLSSHLSAAFWKLQQNWIRFAPRPDSVMGRSTSAGFCASSGTSARVSSKTNVRTAPMHWIR